jgi:hypothetical protein
MFSSNTRVYPKVYGLAAWSENCKWYSSLPLRAVVSLFVSQSSEFCFHNPLCCFSTSVYCCCCLFRYRLSPETFRYTLVRLELQIKWNKYTAHDPRLPNQIPPKRVTDFSRGSFLENSHVEDGEKDGTRMKPNQDLVQWQTLVLAVLRPRVILPETQEQIHLYTCYKCRN